MNKKNVFGMLCGAFLFLLIFVLLGTNNAKAVKSSEEIKFAAELNPSVSITLPENDIVLQLNLQNSDHYSYYFGVGVGTNYKNGYKLIATSNSTSLTRTEPLTDGSYPTIQTFGATETGYTVSNMPVNTWGYNNTNDNRFFPFQTSLMIGSSNGPVNNDTASMAIAARVDYLQPSGTYTLDVDFAVIANVTTSIYMQDLTLDTCRWLGESESFVATDQRDSEEYTVRYIDDRCWMTQDLRVYGVISESGSNFYGDSVNLQESDLTSGNSYTEKRMHKDGDNAWYNFCAASAGTGCTSSEDYAFHSDICPNGWRMPIEEEYASLLNNASFDVNMFNGMGVGIYTGGALSNPDDHALWSGSSASNETSYQRIAKFVNGIGGVGSASKTIGASVRCIMDNRTISDVTYMQEVTNKIVSNTANGQTARLTDRRDGSEYDVRKINNALYMIENLRITGTIYATDSNFSNQTSITLGTSIGNFSSSNASPVGYYDRRYYDDEYEEWVGTGSTFYNYVAATAGTVSGNSNATEEATEDICPAGWRLPSWDDFNGLIGYETAFRPTLHGRVDTSVNQVVLYTTAGNWWSSTIGHDSNGNAVNRSREALLYTSSTLSNNHKNGNYLGTGHAIRCIAK